jgi:hypothetical protein
MRGFGLCNRESTEFSLESASKEDGTYWTVTGAVDSPNGPRNGNPARGWTGICRQIDAPGKVYRTKYKCHEFVMHPSDRPPYSIGPSDGAECVITSVTEP